MAEQTYSWAYSLVDSSQVSTFLISILLIVYGSFRSLNMDFENQDKEKDSSSSAGPFNGSSTNNSIQTIDSTQALFLPIGASVSLLVMFFFFDSVQVVFTICTAVLATIAFAFLLLPMCQISFGCCGRFTAAELLSFSLSVMLVVVFGCLEVGGESDCGVSRNNRPSSSSWPLCITHNGCYACAVPKFLLILPFFPVSPENIKKKVYSLLTLLAFAIFSFHLDGSVCGFLQVFPVWGQDVPY
ncbi:Signal peptide peptidase-like 3 [Varanus komodoensis]|nr:Signal peptide peptidase-like 3 [Varanus komodoensis]